MRPSTGATRYGELGVDRKIMSAEPFAFQLNFRWTWIALGNTVLNGRPRDYHVRPQTRFSKHADHQARCTGGRDVAPVLDFFDKGDHR